MNFWNMSIKSPRADLAVALSLIITLVNSLHLSLI